jgi:thioester reductase-like protein
VCARAVHRVARGALFDRSDLVAQGSAAPARLSMTVQPTFDMAGPYTRSKFAAEQAVRAPWATGSMRSSST